VGGKRLERADVYERPSWKVGREVGRDKELGGHGDGISSLWISLLGGLLG